VLCGVWLMVPLFAASPLHSGACTAVLRQPDNHGGPLSAARRAQGTPSRARVGLHLRKSCFRARSLLPAGSVKPSDGLAMKRAKAQNVVGPVAQQLEFLF
jgi:hypothetical protein